MPTYVYACKDCGHGFEIYQSFDEDALTRCPQCEGQLRKQFNTVGVVFKGSGFYKNDSRSSGGTSSATLTGAGSTTKGQSGKGSGAGVTGSSTGKAD